MTLDDYCGGGGILWPNLTSDVFPNDNIAFLPPCLWHCILAIIPLGWLLLASPFFIRDLFKKRRQCLKVSPLFIAKILFAFAYLISPAVSLALQLTDESYKGVKSLPPAVIVTNSALIAGGVLYLIFLEMTRRFGAITSGTLTVFWIFNTASFGMYFTSVLQNTCWGIEESCSDEWALEQSLFVLFTIQFACSLMNLVVAAFPEDLPDQYQDGSYETDISWLSSSFYSFLTALIQLGYAKTKKGKKTGLEEDDVRPVKYRDRTDFRFGDFEDNWNAECERVRLWNEKHPPKLGKTKQNKVDPDEKTTSDKPDDDDGRKKPSLYRALWATFKHEILITAGWKLGNDILVFVNPQILKALLSFLESGKCPPGVECNAPPSEPAWAGYLYAVGLLLVALLTTFVLQRYWYHSTRVGVHVRCALTAMIYRKSLKINFSSESTTVGEVVNYMSVDAQRFQDTASFMNFLWSAPLQIAVSLYFLYVELNWAAFTILGVFIVLAPISAVCAGKLRTLIGINMKKKDKRIKVMNEILNGIKVLKLYAWEKPFMKKVTGIREEELGIMRQYGYMQAVVILIWEFTPYLVQLVSFAFYSQLIGELNPGNVYTSMSLFNIIRFPINMLPMVFIMVTMTNVASDRIGGFLARDELDKSAVEHILADGTDTQKLAIKKGDFSYKKGGEKVLTDCEVSINKGEIVAVVGPVGCGKSSMVSAMLGEMHTNNAKVKIQGSLAYVPQQAWIQNMSLKDNILFGQDYDEKRYNKIVDCCCLLADLEILESGDSTEIGERGINLSGGQKQRISIARAVYSNADTFIFDDPLSAVDAHVGRRIFDKVLGPNGLLKDKTRMLITHSTQYLPDVDNIVVMENGGSILAEGNLASLKQLKNERVEEIISVKEREEEENVEAKKDFKKQQSVQQPGKTDKKDDKDGKLIAKEKAEEGGVSGKVFTEYFQNFGHGWMLFYIFMSLLWMMSDLLYSIWLTAWVDALPLMNSSNAEAAGQTEECGYGSPNTHPEFLQTSKCYGTSFYLGIYGVIGASIALISFSKSIVQLQGIIISGRKFHQNILTGIMRSPMQFFDTTPTGRIVNRFGKDIDAVDMTIPGSVRSWISCLLRIVSTMAILGRTDPYFLLILPPLFILFFLIERYYIAANRQLKRMESTTRSPIYSNFSETISGTSIIRAYHGERRFITENVEKIDHNLKFQYANLMCNRWLGIRLEAFANLIVFSVAIYSVVTRGNDQSAADMGLALTYSMSITQILNFLIRTTAELEVNLVAIERIAEYSELEPEAKWEKGNGKKGWMQKGEVNFRKYALRYRDGLPLVLKQLNCQISGGEKIGVVGRTGAGKSSLTVGLFRLVEAAEGDIKIDKTETNGLGLHNLRGNLTIIPQEPVLFSGTLRENLDPFDDFDDAKIWKALEHAHLKTAVSAFDKTLQHEINENGSNLSVGERQLVCLARALLRRSKVLILDEATSAVDNNTDGLIQETIRKEFTDMTILTIAHRLNTIIDYDRVMVLDDGNIVEFDSPSKLYNKSGGIFRSMCVEANVSLDDIQNSKFGESKKPKKEVTVTTDSIAKEYDFKPAKNAPMDDYDETDF